jgi:hypothetical protein
MQFCGVWGTFVSLTTRRCIPQHVTTTLDALKSVKNTSAKQFYSLLVRHPMSMHNNVNQRLYLLWVCTTMSHNKYKRWFTLLYMLYKLITNITLIYIVIHTHNKYKRWFTLLYKLINNVNQRLYLLWVCITM